MSERTKAENAKRASNRAAKKVGQAHERRESRTYNDPDVWSLPNNPKRWRYVLHLLINRYNDRHSVKHKTVSNKTKAERRRLLNRVFEFLRKNPEKQYSLDPRSLGRRHVEFIIAHWRKEAIAGRLAPGTLQTYFSHLKTFTGWIRKPNLMTPIACYFDDPKLYKRSYIARIDRSWKAAGVDVWDLIKEAVRIDRHVAAVLILMAVFGFRFKEACMFRPHEEIIVKRLESGEVTHYVDTRRGTKGKRPRFVPILTEEQWEAIEFAKSVAMKPHHSVSDPNLNLKQAMRRARTVMERLGITQRDLHVTPHGLRHEYAGKRYQELSGVAPPVAGGAPIDKTLDKEVRLTVAKELGHGRTQITKSYLGKVTKSNAGTAVQDRRDGCRNVGESGTELGDVVRLVQPSSPRAFRVERR